MLAAREILRSAIVRPLKRRMRMRRADALARYDRARFHCPVCGYEGLFIDAPGPSGGRKYGCCPECGSFERHRLQAAALGTILRDFAPELKSALHFAPEPGLSEMIRSRFHVYKTADLSQPGVDYNCDLRGLPFDAGMFDFVFASHVLEHIQEDRLAIGELYRILKPGGMAVLPVPIVCDATIEYPTPVATEDGHVRGPGVDYFKRYWDAFDDVEIFSSADFSTTFQPFIFEDRSQVPNLAMPYRQPMRGYRHLDYVPVCLKAPCHRIVGEAGTAAARSRAEVRAA